MQIIIENAAFDINMGIRVAKAKAKSGPCPEFLKNYIDMWDSVLTPTFADIAALENLESRRVAFKYFDMEELAARAGATPVRSETIKKSTQWVTETGELETVEFDDTYELWRIPRENLLRSDAPVSRGMDFFFVRMKDTSTDRKYMIWVDIKAVIQESSTKRYDDLDKALDEVSPIAAIAWTMRTTIPLGCIDSIVRQGDCILVKPNEDFKHERPERPLTEHEYRTLVRYES